MYSFCDLYLNTADHHPGVEHSMDVWHKSKLLKKVLNNVSFCMTLCCHLVHIKISTESRNRRSKIWGNTVRTFWGASASLDGQIETYIFLYSFCMTHYEQAGKLRGMAKIAFWSTNIVNDFWY